MLDFGNRNLRRRRHHWIKVARRLAIDEIAPLIAFPSFNKGEVGFEGVLHYVHVPAKLAGFLVLSDHSPESGGGEKCGNPCAAGANAFRESPLRGKLKIDFLLKHHLLQQSIFADIAAYVTRNLPRCQQQAHSVSVHANVIADGGEILRSFANESSDEILRNTAQTEAADHDGCAVRNVADGFIGTGYNFVHRKRF